MIPSVTLSGGVPHCSSALPATVSFSAMPCALTCLANVAGASPCAHNNKSEESIMTLRIGAGLLVAAGVLALAGCGGSSGSSRGGVTPEVQLDVVSSAPDQVSGGDVRIALRGAEDVLSGISLRLNGETVSHDGLQGAGGELEGLVDGLVVGDNLLEVQHPRHGTLASVELVNYPITGPMFSGPHQYPFVCTTDTQFGLQPLVDEGATEGFAVYDDNDQVIGYSRDCSVEPFVEYWYRTTDDSYAPLPLDGS